ncbi:MAG TPA: efflux RND transporter periplasmic adaptor subunit [Candidatus Methylomirabilis sp.]
MRRKIVIVLAALLLAVIGTGFYVFWNGQGRPQFRTAPAERSPIVSSISATGTINPVVAVQVGSQISGMIKELHADFNSVVKKGNLIARIDPETYEAKVKQAQGDLDSAKAAVLNAQRSVARAEADLASARANVARARVMVQDGLVKRDSRVDLFKEGGVAKEELDTAQATYDAAIASSEAAVAGQRSAEAGLEVTRAQLDAARAQVAQKQASLDQARVDLKNTYIRAPVDGTVVSRNVDVGQTVAASLQAPTLFVIGQDLTKMQVDTNVDEADVGRVVLDQGVTFTVDAYPGQPFRGRVVQIRQTPQVIQNVVTYDVVVAVDNPELKLKPGMTANVRILVARKENALVVSNAVFRLRLQPAGAPGGEGQAKRPAAGPGGPGGPGQRAAAGSTQKLWVLKDGKPEERTVRTGLSDGQRTEVVEGLSEGEPVIVATGSGADAPTKAGARGPRLF